MTTLKLPRIQRFCLTGIITEIETDHRPFPKHILVSAQGETYRVKLTKLARKSLPSPPGLGDQVQILGERDFWSETQEFRYKADLLTILQPAQAPIDAVAALTAAFNAPQPSPSPSPGQPKTILICQKSSCCRRGGQAVWDAFSQAIHEQGLETQITLKATGCLKECKRGPAVVLMPQKTRHTRVTPGQVSELLAPCCQPNSQCRLKPELEAVS